MKIREQGDPNLHYSNVLLDTGNNVENAISQKFFEKISKDKELNLNPRKNASMAVEGAKLPILGRVKTPFEITFFSPDANEPRFFKWKVAPLVVPGLLNDFLMSKGALTEINNSVCLHDRTFKIHFNNQPDLVIPIGRRNLRVRTKNNIEILPHHEHELVMRVPEAKVGEELLIEPDPEEAERTGILSLNIVDRVRPGNLIHMRLWNTTDHKVTVKNETTWGVANPYSDKPHNGCVAALAKHVERLKKYVQEMSRMKKTTTTPGPKMKTTTNSKVTPPTRESGTGAEQLLKEHWPRTQKEMEERLWRELDFDNPDCELSKEDKMKVIYQFASVPDAMALGPYDVGLIKPKYGLELAIDTGDHPPIADKCRPVAPKKKEALKAQISRWIGQKVGQFSNGPWAAATVVVAKAGGGYRICADYRRLNQITVRDAGPVAHMGEKLARIKAAQGEEPKYFASIDLSDAYYCVPVREQDRDKTAMITPMGLMRFNRMSFGLKNAPAMWNQVTQLIEKQYLEKLPEVGNSLLMYFDDAVLSAATLDDLIEKLGAFLEVIAEVGCKVQPRKCKIGKRLKWCGHIFDKNGIYPNTDYIQTMKDWDTPTTNEHLSQRTGKLEWVDKFVHAMKTKTHAIWEMKLRYPAWKKNTTPIPIDWFEDPQCQEQWDAIMDELTSAPVLAHPDWSDDREPFVVEVDTSSKGIGAILYQTQWVEDPETGERTKKERVVSFASKRLKGPQRKYSAYKLELLGLLTAVQHWHYFLIDRKFIVRSDHKALKWLTTTTNPHLPNPLHRWQEALNSDYEFEFQWVPGTQLKGVDALSRKLYREGDDGNMADAKLRTDPIWAMSDVDPEEAATNESDEFWMPIMKKKHVGPEDNDSGYGSENETPSIVGAITRSKKQTLHPGLDAEAPRPDTLPDEEEEDSFPEGEGPPLADFEQDDEGWDDLIHGFANEDRKIQEYMEEDSEVVIRPKTAWWWHEYVRRSQNLDVGLRYLKEHIEKALPWPKTNKDINAMVKKAFEVEGEREEERSHFSKILIEQRAGGKIEITRDHPDDPGILTITRKGKRKKQVMIPFAQRTEHLQMVHHGQGTFHRGVQQTISGMEEYFWFPDAKAFVSTYINGCKSCQDGKKMTSKYGPPLGRTSSHENERIKKWAIDIVEMPKGKYGFKYVLTALDVATRWFEAWPLTRATATQVTKIIEEDMIPRFGEDLTFLSDMAKVFISKLMRKITDKRGCKRYFSTPYHANSLPVERYHRTLNSLIRILLIDQDLPKESWPEVLHLALYTMRCTPDSDSKTSAFERLYGRPPATQISSWTGTRPEEKEIPEDFPVRDVSDETPGMYPGAAAKEPMQRPARELMTIPGRDQDFYAAINSLHVNAWNQEYAQTLKDQAALKKHDENAARLSEKTTLFMPILYECVDWKMPYDPDSPESRKFAKKWGGVYAVTAIRGHDQTVQIQKVEKDPSGRLELIPGTAREAYVGDIRPTLTLAHENRPRGNWNPVWIRD